MYTYIKIMIFEIVDYNCFTQLLRPIDNAPESLTFIKPNQPNPYRCAPLSLFAWFTEWNISKILNYFIPLLGHCSEYLSSIFSSIHNLLCIFFSFGLTKDQIKSQQLKTIFSFCQNFLFYWVLYFSKEKRNNKILE